MRVPIPFTGDGVPSEIVVSFDASVPVLPGVEDEHITIPQPNHCFELWQA